MSDLLNIAELCPSSEALGPGKRFIIWVQGCPFDCKNCISPDWIPFKKAQIISIEQLAEDIINESNVSGITISGGEPFMQAVQLTKLIKKIKSHRPALSIIIFSGFQLHQLTWPEAQELINQIDLLIDGLYIEKKNNGIGLRGSSNQTLHFLSTKLMPFIEELKYGHRKIEFHFGEKENLLIGIP